MGDNNRRDEIMEADHDEAIDFSLVDAVTLHWLNNTYPRVTRRTAACIVLMKLLMGRCSWEPFSLWADEHYIVTWGKKDFYDAVRRQAKLHLGLGGWREP